MERRHGKNWRLVVLFWCVWLTSPALGGANGTDPDVSVTAGDTNGADEGTKGTDAGGGSGGGAGRQCEYGTNPRGAYPVTQPDGRVTILRLVKCTGDADWVMRNTCLRNCPPGEGGGPPPPSPADVEASIEGSASAPDGQFAPPIERGGDIAAIVGKRLYFNVTPASYRTVSETLTLNEVWQAAFTITPGKISLTLSTGESATCQGPGASGTTKAGRTQSDSLGCYVLINTKPPGGIAEAVLSTESTIVVTTIIPGVRPTWIVTKNTPISIPIDEIQSIIK